MRNLSVIASIIAFSMMVVVLAVAPKSALAQDAAPAAAPAEVAPVAEQRGASAAGEATPQRTRRAATASEPSPVPNAEGAKFFGGPAQPNHRWQTGLSVMPGTGYRLIVPYQEGRYCGDSSGQGNKRVCARSVPAFLDVQLSFGVSTRADLIVDLRFGLQGDAAAGGNRQFAVAPGLRFWLDQAVVLKFYTTLQFAYDYTDFSKNPGVRSSDYGVRNANGLMYDPIRNVGFYVQFGETFAFARWFRIDLDAGVGAQLRFP